MNVFSLEDDDCPELFITQTPSTNGGGANLLGLLDNPMDFQSPCASILDRKENVTDPKYSDISDDEMFHIPSSQRNFTAEDR